MRIDYGHRPDPKQTRLLLSIDSKVAFDGVFDAMVEDERCWLRRCFYARYAETKGFMHEFRGSHAQGEIPSRGQYLPFTLVRIGC